MHLWIKPPHLRLKERRTAMQRDFHRKQRQKKKLNEVELIVMLLITVKCTRLDRKEIGWFCGKFSSGKSFLSRQARVDWQPVDWLLLPGCCLDFWDCRRKNIPWIVPDAASLLLKSLFICTQLDTRLTTLLPQWYTSYYSLDVVRFIVFLRLFRKRTICCAFFTKWYVQGPWKVVSEMDT